jgi:hypothetical protein
VTEYADVPSEIVGELRAICVGLPEAYEEAAWAGTRWRVRKRTFAHVATADSNRGPASFLTFRSSGTELDVLRSTGHPFYWPGWGTNTMGMVVGDDVDWGEVAELLIESYCIMAPKKLAQLVDRPLD